MKSSIHYSPILLPLLLVACGVASGEDPKPVQSPVSASAAAVEPQLVAKNPTCADLGLGAYDLKFDFGTTGTFTGQLANGESVTWTYDGSSITWSSTIGMDAVIVKGSDAANVYQYNPESTGDSGLVTPINASGGNAGLSHIDFCYDWEVKVTKTAETSYKRQYSWGIDKTGSVQQLLLTPGQIYTASYDVTVNVTGHTDSDWAVGGTITVKNPDPTYTATVTSVSDVFGGNTLPVTCSVTFPATLAPGASFTCTYQSALSGPTDGTNVATAEASGKVGSGEGSAAVSFAGASVTGVDACVTVDDDKYGSLGTVCSDAAPKTFSYMMNIGPYQTCGSYQFDNTASFEADDSGSTGSDSWSVTSEVPCSGGCSLTPGYWKTHSSYGPAPYDDTWAQLPNGANTVFYLSGASYYTVLWTAPQGNAYYILAHAFIAAKLNGLNGANTSAITSALASAEALLAASTPAQIAGLKGKQKLAWITLATILDNYNNGLIGPGHCSE